MIVGDLSTKRMLVLYLTPPLPIRTPHLSEQGIGTSYLNYAILSLLTQNSHKCGTSPDKLTITSTGDCGCQDEVWEELSHLVIKTTDPCVSMESLFHKLPFVLVWYQNQIGYVSRRDSSRDHVVYI